MGKVKKPESRSKKGILKMKNEIKPFKNVNASLKKLVYVITYLKSYFMIKLALEEQVTNFSILNETLIKSPNILSLMLKL